MSEKKIARANYMAQFYYGLHMGEDYVLERSGKATGIWSVYNQNGLYLAECRTDCFDNYRDIPN